MKITIMFSKIVVYATIIHIIRRTQNIRNTNIYAHNERIENKCRMRRNKNDTNTRNN